MNNKPNNLNDINKFIDRRGLTTLAFAIGLALIDGLSSTEQNAVGNWIMLIGQTLCTNGSYTFNDEWKAQITPDVLRKTTDIINREINKL